MHDANDAGNGQIRMEFSGIHMSKASPSSPDLLINLVIPRTSFVNQGIATYCRVR